MPGRYSKDLAFDSQYRYSCTRVYFGSVYGHAIAGTQGTDCMFDIDECAAQPCAIDEECWEGLNEYACKLPAGPNEPYWEGEWGAAQRPTPRQAGEVEDSRLDAVLNALLAGGINTTTLFESKRSSCDHRICVLYSCACGIFLVPCFLSMFRSCHR